MTWLKNLWNKLSDAQKDWTLKALWWVVLVVAGGVLHHCCWGVALPEPVPPGPIPEAKQEATVGNDGGEHPFKTGWRAPSDEERQTILKAITEQQGFDASDFRKAAKKLFEGGDDNRSVFFWDAEKKVLGKILASWNQSSIGSCVGHGEGRGAQDLILVQIANGAPEEWPGAEVCREAIYGGSRVQSGHDGGGGDGSTGGWAVQWMTSDGGILFYKKYDSVDLTGGYSVSRCRQWGNSGCPSALVPIAKQHPIKSAALVNSSDDVWTSLGNGYPVPICSSIGFDSPLVNGFCARRGSWNHCMTIRGRFMHAQKGRCFVIQNSWGDYLKSRDWHEYLRKSGLPVGEFLVQAGNNVVSTMDRGDVELPEGCFGVTAKDVDSIVSQHDSYALSSFIGFKQQKIDWFAQRQQRKTFLILAGYFAENVRDAWNLIPFAPTF